MQDSTCIGQWRGCFRSPGSSWGGKTRQGYQQSHSKPLGTLPTQVTWVASDKKPCASTFLCCPQRWHCHRHLSLVLAQRVLDNVNPSAPFSDGETKAGETKHCGQGHVALMTRIIPPTLEGECGCWES